MPIIFFLFCKRQSINHIDTGIKYYEFTFKTLASYWRNFSLFNQIMIVIINQSVLVKLPLCT